MFTLDVEMKYSEEEKKSGIYHHLPLGIPTHSLYINIIKPWLRESIPYNLMFSGFKPFCFQTPN